ncbi:hypothetical protein U1839_01260 [Sphingomonas sp. RT2P30]|uniref:hypothetical protein n=1 Tax=Parasphingomonas halimpatiens TaxID=3096162 RepID=UPI002FC63CBA
MSPDSSRSGETPHLTALVALRAACEHAMADAARGALFDGVAGMRLCNAAYDVFECDALYDMAGDIAAPMGLAADGSPVLHLADRGHCDAVARGDITA